MIIEFLRFFIEFLYSENSVKNTNSVKFEIVHNLEF